MDPELVKGLQQIKKFLDDGTFSQQDFDKQKSALLDVYPVARPGPTLGGVPHSPASQPQASQPQASQPLKGVSDADSRDHTGKHRFGFVASVFFRNVIGQLKDFHHRCFLRKMHPSDCVFDMTAVRVQWGHPWLSQHPNERSGDNSSLRRALHKQPLIFPLHLQQSLIWEVGGLVSLVQVLLPLLLALLVLLALDPVLSPLQALEPVLSLSLGTPFTPCRQSLRQCRWSQSTVVLQGTHPKILMSKFWMCAQFQTAAPYPPPCCCVDNAKSFAFVEEDAPRSVHVSRSWTTMLLYSQRMPQSC